MAFRCVSIQLFQHFQKNTNYESEHKRPKEGQAEEWGAKDQKGPKGPREGKTEKTNRGDRAAGQAERGRQRTKKDPTSLNQNTTKNRRRRRRVAARRGAWGRGPPAPPWATAASAAGEGEGGGREGNNLGRGQPNTRQSFNILDKNPTYSTTVTAKTD